MKGKHKQKNPETEEETDFRQRMFQASLNNQNYKERFTLLTTDLKVIEAYNRMIGGNPILNGGEIAPKTLGHRDNCKCRNCNMIEKLYFNG